MLKVVWRRSSLNYKNLISSNYYSEKPNKPELPTELRTMYKRSIPSVGQPLSEEWEPGRGPVIPRSLPTRKEIRRTVEEIRKEFGIWLEEIREGWRHDPDCFFRHGQVNKVWTFTEKGCIEDFTYTNDTEHEFGYSTCTLSTTSNGTLIFKGNLSTSVRDDGFTVRSGFCAFRTPRAMKSFRRKWFYDWGMYSHVILKVRGDGRYYLLNLGQDDDMDHTWYDMHSYFIFTRGGPYWQTVKIPFSKFVYTHKGKIQDRQQDFEPTRVSFVGITLCDDVNGPFQLEIEYIGVMYDANHSEESAYETYDDSIPAFKLW